MQTSIQRKSVLLFVFALAALLTACPQHTKIGNITTNPGRYANKEVAISGTVSSSVGLLGTGAFEIDDGSGKIWVLSENYGVPSKGAKVGITGRVEEGVNLGGRSFALALRQTRRPHY